MPLSPLPVSSFRRARVVRFLAAGLLGLGVSLHARTWAPGITEPVQDALLSVSAAGSVKKIFFKEGDAVAEGTVILELDRTLEELEMERRRSVYESRAELEAATQRAEVLKADFESTKRLFEKSQSVSRDEVQKKELEFALAVAERDRLAAAKERERIEFDMAKEQLARRAVTAPFAGIITDLRIEVGEACEPRQPVVRVVDLRKGVFVANLQPALAVKLKVGQDVVLSFDGAAGEVTRTGRIEYLSPVVDSASGLRRLKVGFDNPDAEIAPGVVAKIAID